MKTFLIILTIFLGGCHVIPKVKFQWPQTEQDIKIERLEKEKTALIADLAAKVEQVKTEVTESQNNRYSKGTAQVYAADSTLEANPVQDKYTSAASRALDVAREALPTPKIDDLIAANKIQTDLLSEQASKIAEAQEKLGMAKSEIIEAKNKEQILEAEKQRLIAEKEKERLALEKRIEEEIALREKQRLEIAARDNADAEKWREENSFLAKINPKNWGIVKFISSLFWWVIVILVINFLLKGASLLFPGANIFQTFVGAVGRIIGSTFGLLIKWVPGALRGMNVVDYKDHKIEKTISSNKIGAIEEFKNAHPHEYELLKPFLKDWDGDSKELEGFVDKRLHDLNLK